MSYVQDPNMICHLIRFCTEDVQRPVNQHMLTLLEQFRNAKVYLCCILL